MPKQTRVIPNRVTTGLKKYRQEHSASSRKAVLEAIAYFRAQPDKVTYSAVIKRAGVGGAYFAQHPELKAEVAELIKIRKGKPTKEQKLQQEIKSLKSQIQKLEKLSELRPQPKPEPKPEPRPEPRPGSNDPIEAFLSTEELIHLSLADRDKELIRRNQWLVARVLELRSHFFADVLASKNPDELLTIDCEVSPVESSAGTDAKFGFPPGYSGFSQANKSFFLVLADATNENDLSDRLIFCLTDKLKSINFFCHPDNLLKFTESKLSSDFVIFFEHFNWVWQHYKGEYYQPFKLGVDLETGQEAIAYQCLDDLNEIWIRSTANFLEQVNIDGEGTFPRFSPVFE